jgi:flagellar capping protein FliD
MPGQLALQARHGQHRRLDRGFRQHDHAFLAAEAGNHIHRAQRAFLTSLADIGIVFQRDGSLKLEKPAKLETAIATNFEGVSGLFNSAQTEKRYRTQFTSPDAMMVKMQSMSSYMAQQLAALAANHGWRVSR